MADSELQPWQRPPFERGNTLSVKHGVFSERIVAPLAAHLVESIVATTPYLQDVAYTSAVMSWARTEARIELVSAWLMEHGELDGGGNVRGASHLLNRLEATAENLRARLGLDPLSRSRLGLHRLEAAQRERELTEKTLERYRPVVPTSRGDAVEHSEPLVLGDTGMEEG